VPGAESTIGLSALMPLPTLSRKISAPYKFYWRPQNRWDEFRIRPVTGRHYGTTRPVYVLTSERTFSGAGRVRV
jgi:hypothetical protein